MARIAGASVLMLVGLAYYAPAAHAGPLWSKAAHAAPSNYSHWHYCAPILVKLKIEHQAPSLSQYSADYYSFVPRTTILTTPAVPAAASPKCRAAIGPFSPSTLRP